MSPSESPYAILSLIVAPAILTNTSSVLIMSTSNRLGRIADRARELSKQLESEADLKSPVAVRRLNELGLAQERTMCLIHALRCFYIALASFAFSALSSLMGGVIASLEIRPLIEPLVILGIIGGGLAVFTIINGSRHLLKESMIAVRVISERAANLQARAFDVIE